MVRNNVILFTYFLSQHRLRTEGLPFNLRPSKWRWFTGVSVKRAESAECIGKIINEWWSNWGIVVKLGKFSPIQFPLFLKRKKGKSFPFAWVKWYECVLHTHKKWVRTWLGLKIKLKLKLKLKRRKAYKCYWIFTHTSAPSHENENLKNWQEWEGLFYTFRPKKLTFKNDKN